ncbi:tumor necrosis factor receptor superfamily member 14 isoform X4 [Haplochromis burtoni]|uniref:tumor necrosis factor receptor superfamily member 14 isoform X4 n=1 Tax=Haplochromis burtoni TaxID=8153 RepID=UPI001C2DB2F3|nr:tumor necrosis factor receptor superfamily member 14 isoform X4 [Haplochromis burtoni]
MFVPAEAYHQLLGFTGVHLEVVLLAPIYKVLDVVQLFFWLELHHLKSQGRFFIFWIKENFSLSDQMSSRRKPANAAAFLIILMKVFSGLGLSCHQGEYQIGNECCPNCLAGNRVKSHCTVESSTSCLPCMTGTYTDQPNGLERCHHCTNCDSGSGLRIKTPCTVTSDALCEPLEGFYCVHPTGHSCERAQEHKHCKPGQYISQNGTASTDTECSDCSSGTFSNGTFHSCQPHTQCHSLNLQQITAGTSATDSQCGEKNVVK